MRKEDTIAVGNSAPQAKQAKHLAFVTSLMLKIAIFQKSISPEMFELHPKYFTGI